MRIVDKDANLAAAAAIHHGWLLSRGLAKDDAKGEVVGRLIKALEVFDDNYFDEVKSPGGYSDDGFRESLVQLAVFFNSVAVSFFLVVSALDTAKEAGDGDE